MPCGYCGKGHSLIKCGCPKARQYRSAGLKGGAAKHPNPLGRNAAQQSAAHHDHNHDNAPHTRNTPASLLGPLGSATGSNAALLAPASAKQRPICVRLTAVSNGMGDAKELASCLGHAVRDAQISRTMRTAVITQDAAEGQCYYLRSAAAQGRPDVDHTFECQLMGHALVQSAEWHRLYKQEGFIKQKVSKLGVLGKALADVFAVQNSLAGHSQIAHLGLILEQPGRSYHEFQTFGYLLG